MLPYIIMDIPIFGKSTLVSVSMFGLLYNELLCTTRIEKKLLCNTHFFIRSLGRDSELKVSEDFVNSSAQSF